MSQDNSRPLNTVACCSLQLDSVWQELSQDSSHPLDTTACSLMWHAGKHQGCGMATLTRARCSPGSLGSGLWTPWSHCIRARCSPCSWAAAAPGPCSPMPEAQQACVRCMGRMMWWQQATDACALLQPHGPACQPGTCLLSLCCGHCSVQKLRCHLRSGGEALHMPCQWVAGQGELWLSCQLCSGWEPHAQDGPRVGASAKQ